MAINEGARYHGNSSNKFICVSQFPDVCKLPNGTPVPFSIVAWFDDSQRYSPNVNFGGKPAMTMNGRIKKVKGDEPGKGGGVISNTNKGYCIPITHSGTVNVNGNKVLYRDGTLMWMNCLTPESKPGNTIGKVIYHGKSASANLSGGDSDPPLRPETPAEQGCWGEGGSQGGLAGGLLGDLGGAEGIVGLAQQAAQLAQTDWSNPGSVLGALGGVAGLAGAGDLAKGIGLAQQAYAIAQNPASALGIVGQIAGQGALGQMAGQILSAQTGKPAAHPAHPRGATPGFAGPLSEDSPAPPDNPLAKPKRQDHPGSRPSSTPDLALPDGRDAARTPGWAG